MRIPHMSGKPSAACGRFRPASLTRRARLPRERICSRGALHQSIPARILPQAAQSGSGGCARGGGAGGAGGPRLGSAPSCEDVVIYMCRVRACRWRRSPGAPFQMLVNPVPFYFSTLSLGPRPNMALTQDAPCNTLSTLSDSGGADEVDVVVGTRNVLVAADALERAARLNAHRTPLDGSWHALKAASGRPAPSGPAAVWSCTASPPEPPRRSAQALRLRLLTAGA